MIDDMLIGPVLLDNHTTGYNYQEFLQNGLPEQLESVPLARRIAMYCQHDRAPVRYSQLMMQCRNDLFFNFLGWG
jgi:hypothetical protein